MDHARIDENQLADRYLMGKLDDAQRRGFEEHFVDCPVCQEKLEAIEGLRGALRELPSEQFAQVLARRTSLRRVSPMRPRPLMAFLAAACLVVAGAASLYFYGEARRSRRELQSVRQASEKGRQRQAELEQVIRSQRVSPRPTTEAAMSMRALAAAPLAATVFTLNVTRGATSQPGDRILLPSSPSWLVLLFDRPDRPGVVRYRVQLSTAGGLSVGEPVLASAASGGMLAVSLPSTVLTPGDYLLAVSDEGSGDVLATYRFRATPRR